MAAIRGVVVFRGDERPPTGAIVRLRVEDATLMDTRATIVATATQSVERDGVDEMPFSIEVGDAADPARHSVRVHVDRNGSGRIEEGDWVSVSRHRIGEPELRIPVEPVR